MPQEGHRSHIPKARVVQGKSQRRWPNRAVASTPRLCGRLVWLVQQSQVVLQVQDPELGYTQGMGFVTGQFLMHMCEESAFQLLTQAQEPYQLHVI